MLLRVYEMMLEKEIKRIPKHIVIICSKLDKGFLKFAEWCKKFKIKEITVCFQKKGVDDIVVEDIMKNFRVVYYELEGEEGGGGKDTTDKDVKDVEDVPIINILTYTGHDEILNVVRRLAKMVVDGKLSPDDLNEKIFESFLTVKSQPDIIIKAGNEVPEFLIWQGIYSELYFADIDWENFRYVDFLRILREYQRRERRYGR